MRLLLLPSSYAPAVLDLSAWCRYIEDYKMAQVSINLDDFKVGPLPAARGRR